MKRPKRKKKLKLIIFSLSLVLLLPLSVSAKETIDSIITRQVDILDLDESEKVLEEIKLESSNPYLNNTSIKQLTLDAITGNQDISPMKVVKGIFDLLFGEINSYLNLMGKLMILAIFCTMLSTLSISFQSKSTSQIAFYVCYIVLIITLTESFLIALKIAQTTIDQMTMLMHASVPVMMTLLISTGNMVSGGVFQPLVISSIQIASMLLRNTVLPLVFFVSILEIVSHISEDFKISKLVSLAYSTIKWILRGIVTLFVGIMAMYGLTAPFVDGTINKAAKSMVGTFVPVVGDALSGTVDLIMNCGVIVKNSYTIGVIILLLLICAIPLIKVFLCMAVYQLTSALIEPISDKRISRCMAGMGRAAGYLLGTLSTVMVLFILNMLILIGSTNVTTMIR